MKFRLLVLAGLVVVAIPAFGWWAENNRSGQDQPAPLATTRPAATELLPSAAATDATSAPVAVALVSAPAATAAPSPVAVAQVDAPAAALPTPFFEPAGCQAPPDNYTRVNVNGWTLNARTLTMLQHAAALYGGSIDITRKAITFGSYTDVGVPKYNPGTHQGGGVVDISLAPEQMDHPLYQELEPLLTALRVSGFAAWVRESSERYSGADLHIHAVAIGDRELSPAAAAELSGPDGYFRGFSGEPGANGAPVPDPRGAPLVCQWMRDLGYADLSAAAEGSARPADWREKLRLAASAYEANSVRETFEVAYRIDWLPGRSEDSALMCGPLTFAILRDAGLLPRGIPPLQNIKSFWLPEPRVNGRPWIYFPTSDYDLLQVKTPINEFDFAAWPLLPADIVFTYQRVDGYEHIFVVTEVDANGRAYSVSNYPLKSGSFMVQRVLLYDPADPTVGVLKADWVQDTKTGRTGMAGFDVLRQKGVTLPPGSRYVYTVKPGDTLATIAPAFNTTVESVQADNPLANPYALAVGQQIVVTLGAEPMRDGPAPTPQPTATEPTLPYDVSALAKVVLTSRVQGGRVRSEPNGAVIAAVRDGDPVQVLFGKRLVDNILWLQVRLENGITGWMAGFLLQMTDLNPTR